MGKKVVVIGAGPVGALAALYAAKRGNAVEVYELRGDLRKKETTPLNFTKSINLALSERGINALRVLKHGDLLENVLSQTIPMHGRMVHVRSNDGHLVHQSQAYDVHGRFQRSIDRGGLNATLLDELEQLPNVTLHFQHKLTGADFNKKKAWLEVQGKWSRESTDPRPQEIEIDFDLMLGCDGAHSAVRFHMMKFARVNYTQEYIDCLWCEFEIKPSSSNDFMISPNHLHIWPAGTCMFIALPNLDKSFVCTLFGPVEMFNEFTACSQQGFVKLFDRMFPGIVPGLISEEDLLAQFNRNPHLPLLNIKCTPHHYRGSVVILGDAANAVVPFYGQGMNAGLESVRVLFEQLDESNGDQEMALSNYTTYRTPDTYAIAQLAIDNYVEMRSSVVSPLYKLRKAIEEKLDKLIPSLGWSTQYSRVSFTNTRYSSVIEKSAHQKAVLQGIFASICTVIPCAALYFSVGLLRQKQWLTKR